MEREISGAPTPAAELSANMAAGELLQEAAQRALAYVQSVRGRPVAVCTEALQRLNELRHPLPRRGLDAYEVLRRLDEDGSPATIATTGGRHFGLVVGWGAARDHRCELARDHLGSKRVLSVDFSDRRDHRGHLATLDPRFARLAG